MEKGQDIAARVEAIRQGRVRDIARAITAVENAYPGSEELIDALYPHTGRAWRIGITGPPGAGKSTLVNQLVRYFRSQGKKVAVVAVDPSSPFTGGALLGDRVRFSEPLQDEGVFFRSLAARGALGGLSEAAEAVADLLDAAGYDVILMETVGVGQGEIEVARTADTVVVVLVPESGDAIQAMKAGLMEIADIFAVNKADHPEADALVHALESMLQLKTWPADAWRPVVVKTVALRPEGIQALTEALERHREYLVSSSRWEARRQERLRRRVEHLVTEAWRRQFWTEERRRQLEEAIAGLPMDERAPHRMARKILEMEQIPTTKT